MSTARIALVHATQLAVAPIQQAFERHWPQARRMNLLDDSLSADRAEAAELTPAMVQRFVDLARYSVGTGCGGILFTCSAFGPAIDEAARATGVPTLKPNQAMFEQALAVRPREGALRVGLLATFAASVPSMTEELQRMAQARGIELRHTSVYVREAMDDLAQGRAQEHHGKVAAAAASLGHCDVVMLAQFSMAAARDAVQAVLRCPVLSSPDCAVIALKERMGHA